MAKYNMVARLRWAGAHNKENMCNYTPCAKTGNRNTIRCTTARPNPSWRWSGAEVPAALKINKYNRSAMIHHLASEPSGSGLGDVAIPWCRNGPRLSTRYDDYDDDMRVCVFNVLRNDKVFLFLCDVKQGVYATGLIPTTTTTVTEPPTPDG